MSTYHIAIIQNLQRKNGKNNGKDHRWVTVIVVIKVIVCVICLAAGPSLADGFAVASKVEWYNPSTVIHSDLFRAASAAYTEIVAGAKGIRVQDYDVLSGHGGNGVIVIFSPRLSNKKFVAGDSDFIRYWIDGISLAVKQPDKGKKKNWANIDVVIRGDLFLAAYVAFQDFLVRFHNKNLENHDVIVGYGGKGIMVRFQLRYSDDTPAVFGGDSVDYWVDGKSFAIKQVNYLK